MNILESLFKPAALTIQSFQKVWAEQKFSRRFEDAICFYVSGRIIQILPAKISADLQFITPQGVERVFTKDSCNPDDDNDRQYYYKDPMTGELRPSFICYEGNPVVTSLKSPLISKGKLSFQNKKEVIPAQSMENYYVDADLTAIAYKFFKYILLRFMTESDRREMIIILLAWGAFCLFVGSMITLMLV